MAQTIVAGAESHRKIGEILQKEGVTKFMLVCDSSFPFLSIKDYFSSLNVPFVVFDGFTPNPLYEDVCKGVRLFNAEGCDAIVAVGGGSTLDVAKCIKLYCKMDPKQNYLQQEYQDSGIPLIAVPTTAGTGSEATRYAVIYFEGKKQSVTHGSIIPNYAVLESGVLKTLPLYQKKCTLLDALCQGIESWWSVNSTEESMQYSKFAVQTIMQYKDAYIKENSAEAAEKIMLAANYAGRAINITQTTAAHAMSYKLTSMYKLPHGHAVAVCLPWLWLYMNENTGACIDRRGEGYLKTVFLEIAKGLGEASVLDAIKAFSGLLCDWQMPKPLLADVADLDILADSVNPVRLGNNPVALSRGTLYALYQKIFGNERIS